jgi:endonuclease YncB( thermonuclease family)
MVTNLMTYKIMNYKATFLCIFLVLSPTLLFAWEGKVVGVTDGDTIKVLKDGKQVKIRLASIDCPEKGQPWGNKAKQFTSHMALFQTVAVLPEGEDRYPIIVRYSKHELMLKEFAEVKGVELEDVSAMLRNNDNEFDMSGYHLDPDWG